MASRLRSSRPTFRATSISSGTGCRQGAIFLRRCGGSIFRRRMVGRGHWVFQLSQISLPGRGPVGAWSPFWSRCSTPTPTATGPANLRSMPCAKLASAAGAATGCPISMQRPPSTVSTGSYVERWLKAPVQMEDGSVVPRTAGTPQGGVISPLLANLFLHYAFDTWMARNYPHSPFERYADDAICHCQSAKEARALWSALADRLAVCKLVLHPVKTKIV